MAALEGKLDKVATMLEQAEEDVLAFYAFPPDHWRKLRMGWRYLSAHSMEPLLEERLHRIEQVEVKELQPA